MNKESVLMWAMVALACIAMATAVMVSLDELMSTQTPSERYFMVLGRQ